MSKEEYIKALMLQGEWEADAIKEADSHDDYLPSVADIIRNGLKALEESEELEDEVVRDQ